MFMRLRSLQTGCVLACLLTLPHGRMHAQAADAPPAKKQMPADRRAYRAAISIGDPDQSLAALRAFLKQYPKSSRVGYAQSAIFKLLINNFPQRTSEIEAEARLQVKQAGKGLSRTQKENLLAWLMAEVGTTGVDLPFAEKLSQDAVKHTREAEYNKQTLAAYAKYKAPAPKASELHKQFAEERGENLAVLADVYLREGKQAQATPLVAEAYSLAPLTDDVNTERARLALLNHDDAVALESYERAQLVGAIKPIDVENMNQLYRKAHNGSDAGFSAELDARYNQLFPARSAASKPQPVLSGHTVLLELFTGSACPPCVGGDVAVDDLLEAYPRTEVVALAFDQHIPEPDPLSNPDSVARGEYYNLAFTPTYVLDGQQLSVSGAAREGSGEIYTQLSKLIDTNAAIPTGVELQLTGASADAGMIDAHATVKLSGSDELQKALAIQVEPPPPPSAKPDAKTAPKTAPLAAPAAASAPVEAHFIVNCALVEDAVRYSGENGVRFHRMVVRALARPADTGFAVTPGAAATLDASFDTGAISRANATYLDGYEKHNDRFGKIAFLTKDASMQPGHLAIAAWVQDTVSHHILATALIPVGDHAQATK